MYCEDTNIPHVLFPHARIQWCPWGYFAYLQRPWGPIKDYPLSILCAEKLSSPGLWRSPENMVAENKVVIFFCSASFKFNVTISWYKDDEFVKGMPGAPNQNQTLVIESVTREHEGSYRCVVSNPGNNVTSRSVVLKVACE